MLTGLVVGGVVETVRCVRNGEFLPLVAFLGIPATSLIGCVV